MANLTASKVIGQVQPALTGLQVPIKSGTKIYQGAMVCLVLASGYAVIAGTAGTGRVVGVAQADAATPGSDGAVNVNLLTGVFKFAADATNPPTIADVGKMVYAKDDNTVSMSSADGPEAGICVGLEAGTSAPLVLIGPAQDAASTIASAFKARAVITSIAAYTAASGVLTANANGAIGAQDGVTLAAGDLVMLQAGITNVTAADAGPYVVTAVGTAGSKYVLTRPWWYAHGGPVRQGVTVDVGGEGTAFSGSTWKALCGVAQVIGTNDPKFYPRVVKGSQALTAGAATVSNLQVWTAAQASATDTTAAAATKIVLTAGQGNGSIALTGTTTDVLSYVITNW